MPNHEEKYCAMCTKKFECKVGNITECDCTTIKLSYSAKAFIEQNFFDCLCIQCLKKIQAQFNNAT